MTQITPNIQRELSSHRLLERILTNQKLTFIYDLDETFIICGGEGFTEDQLSKAHKEGGKYTGIRYELEHSYPKSLMQFELIHTLRQLNQGIGFATTSDVNALLKLKLAGVDLNDLNFLVFRMGEFESPKLLGIHKEFLEVNNPDVIDLATYIEAISDKYGIRIGTFQTRYEKRKALNDLCENDPNIQNLLSRKLIAIGDQEQDGYLALPFNDMEQDSPYYQEEPERFRPVKGGLGLMVPGATPGNFSSRYGSEYVGSLGQATAYAAAIVTGHPEGKDFVSMVQRRYLQEYVLTRNEQPVGSVHWINGFSGEPAEAIDSTWSEIEAIGPVINKIRDLID